MHKPVCEHEYVYISANVSQRSILHGEYLFQLFFTSFSLRTVLTLNPDLILSSRLTAQEVPGVFLSLSSLHWDFRHTLYVGPRHPNSGLQALLQELESLDHLPYTISRTFEGGVENLFILIFSLAFLSLRIDYFPTEWSTPEFHPLFLLVGSFLITVGV